ncbi:MAG: flagellar export protein FliJ [Candidatus Baltobacteraceae bacterium]
MSKRFKFSLQAVLEQRKRVEEQHQGVVAERQRALGESERELEHLNGSFARSSQNLRSDHRTLDGEGLRLHYAHLQFLNRAITAQIHVVAERRVALDRARLELLAASKERKVVEKLKERRHETFVQEETRIEQNELDDGNARRFGRTAKVGGVS